jgi:hypothetical protein
MDDQLIQTPMDLHETTRRVARRLYFLRDRLAAGAITGRIAEEELEALEWLLPQLRAAERRLKRQQRNGGEQSDGRA